MSAHHILKASPATVHWGYYDAAQKPVLTIKSGDTVAVDSVSGDEETLPPAASSFSILDDHRDIIARAERGVGPHILTGPIAVEGAAPGDALRVDILEVKLRQDWGFNHTRAGRGALPEDFPSPRRIHIALDLSTSRARMPWGLEFPVAPFFGCMGTAPPPDMGRQTSVVPQMFGGNIDNRDLVAGTSLLLPVFNDGGLLSVGDGHAAQGHGEVNITAIETALTGTLRITVEKSRRLKYPRAETPGYFMTMAFDPDLDEAAKIALRDMIIYIQEASGLSADDAYALCSIAADLIVTQIVDGNKGIHVALPRWALGRS
jgi:acetamidase/formamidase